jgi:hypothetical protein
MAEIIDIRGWLKRSTPKQNESDGRGTIFRVRLCGPDLRWIGLIGGILAVALAREGFYTDFEDVEVPFGFPPIMCMRA